MQDTNPYAPKNKIRIVTVFLYNNSIKSNTIKS